MSSYLDTIHAGNPVSNDKARQILQEARNAPKPEAPSALAFRMLESERQRNDGLPVHMYHLTLEPIHVTKAEERTAAQAMGFKEQYIRHDYPRFLFRRNFDPKFEKQTQDHPGEYIESKLIKTKEQEEVILKTRVPANCGPWFPKVEELGPLPEKLQEAPAVTIARLEAQLLASKAETQSATDTLVGFADRIAALEGKRTKAEKAA